MRVCQHAVNNIRGRRRHSSLGSKNPRIRDKTLQGCPNGGQNNQKEAGLEDAPCRTGGKTISGSRTAFPKVCQDRTGSALRSGQKIVKKKEVVMPDELVFFTAVLVFLVVRIALIRMVIIVGFLVHTTTGGGVVNIGSKIWFCVILVLWTTVQIFSKKPKIVKVQTDRPTNP